MPDFRVRLTGYERRADAPRGRSVAVCQRAQRGQRRGVPLRGWIVVRHRLAANDGPSGRQSVGPSFAPTLLRTYEVYEHPSLPSAPPQPVRATRWYRGEVRGSMRRILGAGIRGVSWGAVRSPFSVSSRRRSGFRLKVIHSSRAGSDHRMDSGLRRNDPVGWRDWEKVGALFNFDAAVSLPYHARAFLRKGAG